jgi:hypothetical protein
MLSHCTSSPSLSFRQRAGRQKNSRDIVKLKVRNKFFDDYHDLLWEVLITDVFDVGLSGECCPPIRSPREGTAALLSLSLPR